MKKKIQIHLKAKDRKRLNEFVKKGEAKARKITRCHILLLSDKKESNGKISRTLNIALLTIRRIQQRYIEGGLKSAIEERPRSGKPPKFSGKQQAQITALACSTPPEGRSRWTLRLLADKVVELELVDDISYKSVGEILKKRTEATFKETMVYWDHYARIYLADGTGFRYL